MVKKTKGEKMSYKIGDKVIAILCADKENGVQVFGEGVYEGDFYPEEAVGFFADAKKEMVAKGKAKLTIFALIFFGLGGQ